MRLPGRLRGGHTFTFAADGDSTRVKLVIHGAGQLRDGWADALSGVWDHFLGRYAEWANTGRPPAE
ncbi:MAG: hypothetical protein R3B81_16210 [bacterium]